MKRQLNGVRLASLVPGLAILLSSPVLGKTVFVSPSGADSQDGLEWATAKLTVQAGLNASVAGDEVWVAGGTYVENITLKGGVVLYGGFSGEETHRDQRNWIVNVTVLDGNKAGSVVNSPSGSIGAAGIDGFTITNGTGSVSLNPGTYGGGVYCASATTLTNCILTANTASMGGGVYCTGSPIAILDCTIAENVGGSGAGIGCAAATPTITGNLITGNTGDDYTDGGGICLSSCSQASIAHNVITGNTGGKGGGVYLAASSASLVGNTIRDNHAQDGGGLYLFLASSVVITNNDISRNQAAWCGGGIGIQGRPYEMPEASIQSNAIAGNTGDGIYLQYTGAITIVNNTVVSNGGAGVVYADSNATIANNIIAHNSGGLRRFSSEGDATTLRYNCVYGNRSYDYSGMDDPTGTNGNISADPMFSSVDAGLDGLWGTPDDRFDDLRLLPGSACVDAGSNNDVPKDTNDLDGDGNVVERLPFDLGGDARFADDPNAIDTGVGTAPIVDMGAYERFIEPTRADFNGDGRVGADDLEVLLACATGPALPYDVGALPAGCSPMSIQQGVLAADFDSDHDIDSVDFAVFQRCWSGGSPADPTCAD